MAITNADLLTLQLERLRAIIVRLETIRSGTGYETLLERARATVADVRTTRAALQHEVARRAVRN